MIYIINAFSLPVKQRLGTTAALDPGPLGRKRLGGKEGHGGRDQSSAQIA
jgi:hypothetical protein